MSDSGLRAARRALTMIGVPFQLGGRDPLWGLDCVGLVLASYHLREPGSHPRRASILANAAAPWARCLTDSGFDEFDLPSTVSGLTDGDVLLLDCGRRRWHLALRAGSIFVHAHAVLGEVVAGDVLHDMTPVSRWRYRF